MGNKHSRSLRSSPQIQRTPSTTTIGGTPVIREKVVSTKRFSWTSNKRNSDRSYGSEIKKELVKSSSCNAITPITAIISTFGILSEVVKDIPTILENHNIDIDEERENGFIIRSQIDLSSKPLNGIKDQISQLDKHKNETKWDNKTDDLAETCVNAITKSALIIDSIRLNQQERVVTKEKMGKVTDVVAKCDGTLFHQQISRTRSKSVKMSQLKLANDCITEIKAWLKDPNAVPGLTEQEQMQEQMREQMQEQMLEQMQNIITYQKWTQYVIEQKINANYGQQ